MADQRRHSNRTTYGNVAYDLDYQRNVVPVPDGGEPYHRPRPRKQERTGVRPRRRVVTRPKVRLRPKEAVAPFAVIGFALVAVMAAVVLVSYVQLNSVYADTVELRNDLIALQSEESALKAEYEEVFNTDVLNQAVKKAGNLKPAANDQVVYVELSDPDNIVVYEQKEESGGISAFLQNALSIFGGKKS